MNFSHPKAKKPPSENAKLTLVSQLQPHPQQLPIPILPIGVPQVLPSQHFSQDQHKSPPSFDFIFDPSKKIKHTQDTFTQRVSEVKEAPLKERTIQANKFNFLRGESGDALTKNLVSYLPGNTGMDLTPQIPLNQYFSNQGLNPRDMSMFLPSPTVLDLLKYQQLEQQLRQQQLINQYRVHSQLFNQLESHQLKPVPPQAFTPGPIPGIILPQSMKTSQNFPSSLLNQQNEALRKNLLMTKNVTTVPEDKSILEPRKSILSTAAEKTELEMPELKDKEELQLLKESKLASKWESISNSSEGQIVEKKKTKEIKTKPKIRKPRAKKIKSESQEKGPSLIQQELDKLKKNESRRKNKWQEMAEQKLQETKAEDQTNLATGQERRWQREDEREVDYEYLLSVMITNDAGKIGRENPETNFVVLTRDTVSKEGSVGSRIGSKYQVSVADCQLKSQRREASKRKIPELMWNPDIVSENQMLDYVDSVCKLLKCERINMERALKLLKRKDYKKDKVLLNISKNEKFYSTFLVVKDESVAQDKQPDM